jgi:hypothetical protein
VPQSLNSLLHSPKIPNNFKTRFSAMEGEKWQYNDLLIEATQVCCELCILQQTLSLRLWQ